MAGSADAGLPDAEIERYGPVARTLHWLVALLAAIVVLLGWVMPEPSHADASRGWLLVLHRSVGLSILALMLGRGLWRLRHPPPPLPAELPRLEVLAAQVTHALLYLVFLVMPVAGYLNAAFAGDPVSLFGLVAIPPLVPESDRLSHAAIAVHLVGQYFVYGLVGLHVGAALLHRFVRRNRILERMLPPWIG